MSAEKYPSRAAPDVANQQGDSTRVSDNVMPAEKVCQDDYARINASMKAHAADAFFLAPHR
jgi:hypothetical protein